MDDVTLVRHVYQGLCPRAELGDCVTLDLSYQGCSHLPDNMPLTGLSLTAPPYLPQHFPGTITNKPAKKADVGCMASAALPQFVTEKPLQHQHHQDRVAVVPTLALT